MARTVADAAHLMDVLTGTPGGRGPHSADLDKNGLKGIKLLVPENLWDWNAPAEYRQVRPLTL